jgi:hypothetical protein
MEEMTSAVRECSAVREVSATAVGRGMDSEMVSRRGRMSSIKSGSGGRDRGDRSEEVREWKRRVWWRICVERAVCAVMSLVESQWELVREHA